MLTRRVPERPGSPNRSTRLCSLVGEGKPLLRASRFELLFAMDMLGALTVPPDLAQSIMAGATVLDGQAPVPFQKVDWQGVAKRGLEATVRAIDIADWGCLQAMVARWPILKGPCSEIGSIPGYHLQCSWHAL